MQITKHIYSLNYHYTEQELCRLESKYIFNKEEKDKLLFSDIKVSPAISAFIKGRFDIISFSEDYETLLNQIQKESISAEGFKVEYLVFEGDKTKYKERLQKLRDIGYSIKGEPDYYHPTSTYALCLHEGIWCFGIWIKNNLDWHKHKQKPHSYSNSISIFTAKALVNIASKANKESKLLDACCGVGTILLEACFAGINIEGCDINWKIVRGARKNIAHFNYTAPIYRSDIKDLNKRYDAAILDLPYNLVTQATEEEVFHIIESSAKIADKLVIVSISDITNFINKVGFNISDHCSIPKRGKRNFSRRVWVCTKK